jgi:hypothetical protein
MYNELGGVWRETVGTVLGATEESYEKSQIVIEPSIHFILVSLWWCTAANLKQPSNLLTFSCN